MLQLIRSSRGRGLAATEQILGGTVLFDESPLVAHRVHSRTLCPHCFRDLKECSAGPCLPLDAVSTSKYLDCLSSAKYQRFVSRVESNGNRFPALAAKFLLRCQLTEKLDNNKPTEGMATLRDAMDSLMAPTQAIQASSLPSSWRDEHESAAAELKDVVPGFSLDLRQFAGVLGRLHLNAIRTDGDVSTLFAMGSYFNHGCRPNVAPRFNGGHVEWVALRNIAAAEECLISYRDSQQSDQPDEAPPGALELGSKSRPESARDEWLHWNYGFRCAETCSCGRFDK